MFYLIEDTAHWLSVNILLGLNLKLWSTQWVFIILLSNTLVI